MWSIVWFKYIRATVSMVERSSFAKPRKKPMNYPLAMISRLKRMFFTVIFHRTSVNSFSEYVSDKLVYRIAKSFFVSEISWRKISIIDHNRCCGTWFGYSRSRFGHRYCSTQGNVEWRASEETSTRRSWLIHLGCRIVHSSFGTNRTSWCTRQMYLSLQIQSDTWLDTCGIRSCTWLLLSIDLLHAVLLGY